MREGKNGFRIPAGCAVAATMSRSREIIGGGEIVRSIAVMRERSNGLGGGFAGYGIYPEYAELYALHIFYDSRRARDECERFLEEAFDIVNLSRIPTKKVAAITDAPLIWRYFVQPMPTRLAASGFDPDEFVVRAVMRINSGTDGAYVVSSGKNMGVFKAVGYPEEVGEFYRLDEYGGYCWTAHGRYPTNTPGWWGGAHPFSLLGLSVVHNGEISSYDANRRTVEMYGYRCGLLTDTEVIAYIVDYLTRRVGLTLAEVANVVAAPFWSVIERKKPDERRRLSYLREAFSEFLITGPFSVLIGFDGGLAALGDRLKLRSTVVAEKGSRVYMASEECAVRAVCPDPARVFHPEGGELVMYTYNGEGEGVCR